jgi:hypothetical protein
MKLRDMYTFTAGDEMEILIFPEGNWRFIDET